MEVRRRTVTGVALLCLFLAAMVASPARAEESPPWRVVLIRGWDALYRVNIMRESAMREAMGANAGRLVEIYPEEIDPLRFPGPELPELVTLLKRKYSDKKIDLVIASGREPLEFAGRHRDEIWPHAPILFNGVYDGQLDGWKRPPRTTGVTARLDVAGTLRVARKLLPNAKKAYFVAGTSDFDRFFLEFARREAASVQPAIEIEELVGLAQPDLLDRVRRLERDSFVLHLTALRDGRGEFGGPGVGNVARVAASSNVPVFSAVHTQWGRGPVGGSSSRTDLHGQAAGHVARLLLEGANPDDIPIRSTPEPTCELDATAMERWGVSVGNAPLGCAIVNRPASWRTYFWSFLGLAAVIMFQAALIWMLWRQSRERRRVEAQLRQRGAELAQVARLSMMGALTASIAHEINQPMGAILSNAEAAEMMLERGELKPEKLREILADIRTEDLRASQVISGLRKLLAQHETKPLPLDVNAEVAEALRHVTFEAAHKRVSLIPGFDADLPPVLGDPVQLQQVVINLAMNAVDAVASQHEHSREVRVSTQACTDGVQIVVSDRGAGVPRDDEGRLFESMFTTKNEGMGLGLSIVRAIVESFGGRVWYERNVPRGAVFRVWLPAMGR